MSKRSHSESNASAASGKEKRENLIISCTEKDEKRKITAATETKDSQEAEALLEEQAVEELIREAKVAKVRAEVTGTWKPRAKVNTRLLTNTLGQTLQNNLRKSRLKKNKKQQQQQK